MEHEEWRAIEGYEGLYEVSNLGRVRSLDRWMTYSNGVKHFYAGQIMSPRIVGGYKQVGLRKEGKQIQYKVHRLVAEAFLPNSEQLPQVNHIDENKTNNRVENLEWVTAKENVNHGTAISRRAKKRSKPVMCVETNTFYFSASEAARTLNTSRGHINDVCRGDRQTCAGFHWKFVEN